MGEPLARCMIVGLASAQVLLQDLSGDTEHEGCRRVDYWRLSFSDNGIVCVASWDFSCVFGGALCEALDCLFCEFLRGGGGGEAEETD
jgi:hypothetical protein